MAVATVLLARAALHLVSGDLDPGTLPGVADGGRGAVFLWTLGLFALQAVAAGLFDGAHARGGWRVLPLCLVFPVYFWLVVYPSFVIGGLRGLVSSGSAHWARTERAPVPADPLVAEAAGRGT